MTTKVLVLYHSSYGHIEEMAQAVADGAASVADTEVALKRVPELMDKEMMQNAGMKVDQKAPVAEVSELADYDAIIFGSPTRFGNVTSQMRNFMDQTGGLWYQRKLVNKIGSVFTSTATGGGNESTILSFIPTLLHHGMIVVGTPYTIDELNDVSQFRGGSPYGAGTVATGPDGNNRSPIPSELAIARQQGERVATIAKQFKS